MISQLGIIDIPVNKAGLVFKKYGKKTKRVVATNGEAGYQAELLSGGNRYYNLPKLQYNIKLIDSIIVKDNELALVYARDGKEIEWDMELGKTVECDNFQDATSFFKNGGERGNQLKFLTKGEYFLNPRLFRVITKNNAEEYGLAPSELEKVIVNHNEIALVIAKYGKKITSDIKIGKAVSCKEFQDAQAFLDNGGEKGEQVNILEEGEYYINPWFFKVITKKNAKEHGINPSDLNKLVVEPNEIALVSAKYGKKNTGHVSLGKIVHCNNFQDGQAFLDNGGEKGNQLQILTEGEYFINPLLFKVISKNNATDNNFLPKDLNKYFIPRDTVGIVNILVGQENHYNEISKIDKQFHDSYQKPQLFFEQGGCMGIQEEVLTSGTFAINPWFAEIKEVPIVEILTGTVGVVVSHTGVVVEKDTLVKEGNRGIWSQPLREGKHPLNTDTKTVKLIPTNEISLEWKSKEKKKSSNYDIDLEALELKTKDGYSIILEVSQTIQIRADDAPKLILKVASSESNVDSKNKEDGKYPAIRNLINKKIKAMVQSHFTTVGHTYDALEFKEKKGEIQEEALGIIEEELNKYGVDAKALAITIKEFPKEIELKLQKIAEEKQKREVLEAEIESQENIKKKLKIRRMESCAKIKLPEYSRKDMSQYLLEEIEKKLMNISSKNLFKKEIKKVEFSVFTQDKIEKNKFNIDVWAYLAKQYNEVKKHAQRLNRDNLVGYQSAVNIEQGTQLDISLKIDTLKVLTPTNSIVWEGIEKNTSFLVEALSSITETQHCAEIIIRCKSIVISKINFLIELELDKKKAWIIETKKDIFYPKSAFASYSSKNREEVYRSIQGIKKVAPDLNIFMDKLSLRSGDNWEEKLKQNICSRDIFYLFWSKDASKSKWVEKEWKMALEERGLDYINPIPLEDIDVAPPPNELQELHFSDIYVLFINSEKYNKIEKGK